MFYEFQNSLNIERLISVSESDFNYPEHLHSSFELLAVTDGMMEVTVDSKVYTIEKGQFCLIFPNQIHEIHTPVHSEHISYIFSEKIVQAYSNIYIQYIPINNLFKLNEHVWNALRNLKKVTSVMQVKGLLYLICADFHQNSQYVPRSNNDSLFYRIFSFVDQNYNKDCSLEALSKEVSYHYVYLSKFFNDNVGCSYAEYVNKYRLNEACYLLRNTSDTIANIAFCCGFNSIRNFNRVFQDMMGKTPTEYKKAVMGIK